MKNIEDVIKYLEDEIKIRNETANGCKKDIEKAKAEKDKTMTKKAIHNYTFEIGLRHQAAEALAFIKECEVCDIYNELEII